MIPFDQSVIAWWPVEDPIRTAPIVSAVAFLAYWEPGAETGQYRQYAATRPDTKENRQRIVEDLQAIWARDFDGARLNVSIGDTPPRWIAVDRVEWVPASSMTGAHPRREAA